MSVVGKSIFFPERTAASAIVMPLIAVSRLACRSTHQIATLRSVTNYDLLTVSPY